MELKKFCILSFLFFHYSLFNLGCFNIGTSMVKLNYQPKEDNQALLASVSPTRFKLHNLIDYREEKFEAILIGRKEAAWEMPIGDVHSDRPIFVIMSEAVKRTLIRCGHKIVSENSDIVLSGQIITFWASTPATELYWDVTGEVSIVLEAKRPQDSSHFNLGPYNGNRVERTYSNPNDELLKRVLEGSIDDTMRAMSNDKLFVQMLKKD